MNFIVPTDFAGERLDRYLASVIQLTPPLSRSRVQLLIEKGHVTRNNAICLRSRESLKTGDVIDVDDAYLVENALARKADHQSPLAEAIPLSVLFEDEALLVINKPPGLTVHPGAGNYEHTLVNALLHHYSGSLSMAGGQSRPGIVHRLDKDTSGCIVIAKSDRIHHALSRQFADRTTQKRYVALVRGRLLKPTGVISARIGRHATHRKKMAVQLDERGRDATTEFRVIAGTPPSLDNQKVSWVEFRPLTGRTHQIRVHSQYIGHPIVGDCIYGGSVAKMAKRQLLHAWKLSFLHPLTGETASFRAPFPDDFLAFDPTLTENAGD